MSQACTSFRFLGPSEAYNASCPKKVHPARFDKLFTIANLLKKGMRQTACCAFATTALRLGILASRSQQLCVWHLKGIRRSGTRLWTRKNALCVASLGLSVLGIGLTSPGLRLPSGGFGAHV